MHYRITANDIIEEARSWVGTSFHHQGRIKKTDHSKGGCDCLGLIVGVASALNLTSPLQRNEPLSTFDKKNYSRSPDGEMLCQVLRQILPERSAGIIFPSDIVLFRIKHLPQHVGIVSHYRKTDELGIIHAYAPAGKVVEHRFDTVWQKRIISAYQFTQEKHNNG